MDASIHPVAIPVFVFLRSANVRARLEDVHISVLVLIIASCRIKDALGAIRPALPNVAVSATC